MTKLRGNLIQVYSTCNMIVTFFYMNCTYHVETIVLIKFV